MRTYYYKNDDEISKVGENIRRWRTLKGIKQYVLADRLGITPATMSHIENNKSDITLRRLNDIAYMIGIQVGQLLDDPESLLDKRKIARLSRINS